LVYWLLLLPKKGGKKGKNPFRSSGDRIVKKHEHAVVRIKESLKGNKTKKLLHFSDPTLLFESLIEPLKSKKQLQKELIQSISKTLLLLQ